MSYSTVSPDSSSLVFDDTSGRISVLNLSTTAVNTFDFKTQEAKASDDYAEGAGFAQMQMLQQMMGGYAPGAEDYEVGLSAAARAKGKPEGKPEDARDDSRPVLGVDPVKARQRSKLRRKRRELRPRGAIAVSPRLAPASPPRTAPRVAHLLHPAWVPIRVRRQTQARGTCTTTGTVHRPRRAVSPICSGRTSARLAPRPPARLAWRTCAR